MTTAKARDGAAAEALAARHLEGHGLRIVARNYRCHMGEIDLVAQDDDTLVFVEVRLRRSNAFGGAAASIDAHKRKRVLTAARHYLAGKPERACRFDVVVLDGLADTRVEWLRDAFSA